MRCRQERQAPQATKRKRCWRIGLRSWARTAWGIHRKKRCLAAALQSGGRGRRCDTIEGFRAWVRARGKLRADKETQNDGDEASPCRRDFGWGSSDAGVCGEREVALGESRAGASGGG